MAQTSDKMSSKAARYARITPPQVIAAAAKDSTAVQLAADIRSLAASVLRQDERKGLRGLWRKVIG